VTIWWTPTSRRKVRAHRLTVAGLEAALSDPDRVDVFAYPNPADGWPREAIAGLTGRGLLVVVYEVRPDDPGDPDGDQHLVIVTAYRAGPPEREAYRLRR
jgi:uncharacterized DUF497 family protein